MGGSGRPFESALGTGQEKWTRLNGTGWVWSWRFRRPPLWPRKLPWRSSRKFPYRARGRRIHAAPLAQAAKGLAAKGLAAKEPAAKAPAARNVALPSNKHLPAAGLSAFAQANVGLRGALFASRATFKPLVRPTAGPFAAAPTTTTSAADIALVKEVIASTRKGKEAAADTALNLIVDPVARKLGEWIFLRSDNTNPKFQRYATFLAANPSWPHSPLFRRRAENALWNDKLDELGGECLLRQEQTDHRQGTLHSGAHLARPRRSRRSGRAGARGLAHG